MLGWHPTLHDFSFGICVVTTFLAAGYAFKSIPSAKFWFECSDKERKNRVLKANLWLAVCWVLFTLRIECQVYLDRIGMRGIYINSILMSLAYVVPLAILPVFFLGKEYRRSDTPDSIPETPIRQPLTGNKSPSKGRTVTSLVSPRG